VAHHGLHFDGGEGADELILVGTDRSELIEVLAVPDIPVPDPELRVTDLGTGKLTFHGFVVETEDIKVEAAGGDDRLLARLTGGPRISALNLDLLAGDGDDWIGVVHDGTVQNLSMLIDAGAGNDVVGFAGFVPEKAGPVAADVAVSLGAGNDRLLLGMTVQAPRADVRLSLDGDGGNDFMAADLRLGPQTGGSLDARMHGGDGQDRLRMTVFAPSAVRNLFALIDGGPGIDGFEATDNVRVLNCEQRHRVRG
jgi:hypothetical protein